MLAEAVGFFQRSWDTSSPSLSRQWSHHSFPHAASPSPPRTVPTLRLPGTWEPRSSTSDTWLFQESEWRLSAPFSEKKLKAGPHFEAGGKGQLSPRERMGVAFQRAEMFPFLILSCSPTSPLVLGDCQVCPGAKVPYGKSVMFLGRGELPGGCGVWPWALRICREREWRGLHGQADSRGKGREWQRRGGKWAVCVQKSLGFKPSRLLLRVGMAEPWLEAFSPLYWRVVEA